MIRNIFIAAIALITFGNQNAVANFGGDPQGTDNSAATNYATTLTGFIYQPDTNLVVDDYSVKAGLLYDLESRKIVWQKEMNSAHPIASLTKMMVALLAVEDVRAGKTAWTDTVRWVRQLIVGSGKHRRTAPAAANYTLYDLFKAAMVASNNEAAQQIATFLGGGNLDIFIQRMNMRARELSMTSTYYSNPTGLPSSPKIYDNTASPVDLLVLTLEMLKYDEILKVTGLGYTDISNGKNTSIIQNHNHLTIDYSGEVDGMKTGYTKRAGFCLVATTNKCDHRLVSIVLGSTAPKVRNEIVASMFNDYYTSIGLDKLGTNCVNPNAVQASVGSSNEEEISEPDGEYVYQTKQVNKIHLVKKGEHLSTIAGIYGCTLAELRSWNHLKSTGVRPGQRLIVKTIVKEKTWIAKADEIDSAKDGNKSVTVAAKPKQEPKPEPKFVYHLVQPGDTLSSIARRYSVSNLEELKSVNGITNAKILKVGSKIKIPVNG